MKKTQKKAKRTKIELKSSTADFIAVEAKKMGISLDDFIIGCITPNRAFFTARVYDTSCKK